MYSNPLELEPGSLLGGRFEIEREIGRGGFATVYRATQRPIDRPVAIKVLDPANDAKRQLIIERRFLGEARAAARIEHPHVVSIHDFGFVEETRQPFIVMELLEGHDLGDELRMHGPMRFDRAASLLLPCLDALGVAHAQGIVHKDLKPSNLFLAHPATPRERLVIVDFGLARLHENTGLRLTDPRELAGTVNYAAPEYIEHQIVTPALDVYQMGLVLTEMLTGRSVVHGETAFMCILQHVQGNLDVPQILKDGPLGPLLNQALALDPDARYVDGVAFHEALSEVPREIDTLTAAVHGPRLPRPFDPTVQDMVTEPIDLDPSPLRVSVVHGSVTQGTESVLVNPSNTHGDLQGVHLMRSIYEAVLPSPTFESFDKSVSGSIAEACGPGFQAVVDEAREARFGDLMLPGEVLITSAGHHPIAQHVAHAAIMDLREGYKEKPRPAPSLIRQTCRRLWRAIHDLGDAHRSSVAMVALGAGLGQLGVRKPIEIACETFSEYIARHPTDHIKTLTFYAVETHAHLVMIDVVHAHFDLPLDGLSDDIRAFVEKLRAE